MFMWFYMVQCDVLMYTNDQIRAIRITSPHNLFDLKNPVALDRKDPIKTEAEHY